MASASKTPNLNLPQWVEGDKPQRADFNDAMNILDGIMSMSIISGVRVIRWSNGLQVCIQEKTETSHASDGSALFTMSFSSTPFFASDSYYAGISLHGSSYPTKGNENVFHIYKSANGVSFLGGRSFAASTNYTATMFAIGLWK